MGKLKAIFSHKTVIPTWVVWYVIVASTVSLLTTISRNLGW